MSREARRVPPYWQHPRNAGGHYETMHASFPYNEEEIAEGLRDGWLHGEPPHYNIDVMPDWPDSERTSWQMYETTTEGTPISPVFSTPEELAHWLADTKASAFADMPASFEKWLATILSPHGSVGMVHNTGTGETEAEERDPKDTGTCTSCGDTFHMNDLDGADDGTGNFTLLECRLCYGPGFNAL